MMSTRAARLRLLGLVLSVAIASALVWVVIGGDLDTVQSTVESTGAWGPVAYVALHVLLTLVPVSKNLLAGVAGALFGLAGGIALSWVGAMVSAVVTFAIARRLGRAAVASMTGPRIDRVEEIMRQQGLLAVIIARVTPVIPFTVVNYGAGVTAVSTRDFVLGTAIGIVPGTVGYAALGASAGRDATTFVIAGIVAVVLFAGSLLLGWRAARHQQRGVQ
ncbi:TVP38/TMEM64 family protein [Ornithinibacter aureus]|uniref:TVP38/TMEM64 family membrane protein n=2 Tax=Ornithinibacter aureus TaxID=622664 RepID=A0ABP8JX45_9MICO